MMKCTTCKGAIRPAVVELKVKAAGHTFVADVAAGKCASCGEVFYPSALLDMVDLIIAATLVRSGERSGEVMRFVRKAIGMPAKELAELMGMSPEHVSRLETGKSPVSGNIMVLLGSMAIDMVNGKSSTREALEAMREPKKLPKKVAIALPVAARKP